MYKKLVKIFFCIAIFSLLFLGLTVKADTDGDFVVENGVLLEYKCNSANVGEVKVANISLYGEGKGELKFNLFPVYNNEPKITLDFGIELEVGWLKYDQSLITAVFPKGVEEIAYVHPRSR